MIRDDALLCDPLRKRFIELRNQQNLVQFVTSFHETFEGRNPYTLGILEELHRLTVADIYPCAGDIRRHYTDHVQINASFTPDAPTDVGIRLPDLIDRAQRWRKSSGQVGAAPGVGVSLGPLRSVRRDRLIIASRLFYDLLVIHPFRGGNGRVSRAFLHLLLYDMELLTPPLQIFEYFERRRANYFRVLRTADAGDGEPLVEYVMRGVVDAIVASVLKDIEEVRIVYDNLDRDLKKFFSAPHRDVLSDESYLRRLVLFNRKFVAIQRRIEAKPKRVLAAT